MSDLELYFEILQYDQDYLDFIEALTEAEQEEIQEEDDDEELPF